MVLVIVIPLSNINQVIEVNYYMLRQVDYDGNEEEFSIININVPVKNQQTLNYVYFNPLGQLGGQQLKKQIK